MTEVPREIEITRIVGLELTSRRPKLVGKNSRLGVHGDHSVDRIVRFYTADGMEAFGCCRAEEKVLGEVLGKNPVSVVMSKLGTQTMPLWDLMGRMADKPVYELLGGENRSRARARVPVYDGSIYFSDLLEQYSARWQERFGEEIDDSLKRGHRAVKVKIGRGARWMERESGDARDIEVLKLIRKAAGPDVAIYVDANNGYDPERTRRLLEMLDFELGFIEEMFPEDVEKYLKLKAYLREHKFRTLIADGETQRNVEPLKPFMRAGAIDVYQLDVNQVGCQGLVEEASLCRANGGAIAPHTWGTLIGFYAQLHVACAIPNFYSGEQDPLSNPGLIAEGYKVTDGFVTVPDAPGFGLKLDEQKAGQDLKVLFDLKE